MAVSTKYFGLTDGTHPTFTTTATGQWLTASSDTAKSNEYQFPNWVKEGALVVDDDDEVWVIVAEYTEERGGREIGMIQVEHSETGEEKEFCIENREVVEY